MSDNRRKFIAELNEWGNPLETTIYVCQCLHGTRPTLHSLVFSVSKHKLSESEEYRMYRE